MQIISNKIKLIVHKDTQKRGCLAILKKTIINQVKKAHFTAYYNTYNRTMQKCDYQMSDLKIRRLPYLLVWQGQVQK